MIVKTITQAETWFLNNHSGEVTVELKDGTFATADSYPEAVRLLSL